MEYVKNPYSPPENHPEAIKQSQSIFELILYTSLIAGSFTLVFKKMLDTIPVPKLILQIEDSKERTKRFQYYIGYILSWAHAPVTAILGAYFNYSNGITYCDPNITGEKWLIYVYYKNLNIFSNQFSIH
jgi:hypothetical protein